MIGRFAFDPRGFVEGIRWLEEDMRDPLLKYIILDEVGPLELKGLGWDAWLSDNLPFSRDKTLIIVVRNALLDDVIKRYHLEDTNVVEKDFFMS